MSRLTINLDVSSNDEAAPFRVATVMLELAVKVTDEATKGSKPVSLSVWYRRPDFLGFCKGSGEKGRSPIKASIYGHFRAILIFLALP